MGEVDGFLVSRRVAIASSTRRLIEDRDSGMEGEERWEDEASRVDGVIATRADGTPRVPAFLIPLMDEALHAGNHQRLLRTMEGEADAELPTLRDSFRLALLHFLPQPSQSPPPPSPPSPQQHSPSPVSIQADSSARPAMNDWMDSQALALPAALPSPTALLSTLSPFIPSPYALADPPSFSDVRVATIPPFSTLPEPRIFPPLTPPQPASAPPSLTALSRPYVDPFIRQLLERADLTHPNPHTQPSPPPPTSSSPSTPPPPSDAPLSSLVHDALTHQRFRAPPALPLFESGLLRPLHGRFLSSSQRLHTALFTRCSLLSWLSALRGFFLSAEGVLLDDFIAVFRTSQLSTPLVNDRLSEALSALPPSSPCRRFLVGRLRAVHGEAASFSSISSSFSSSSVSLLLTLTFHLDVPYPLDCIITADHLRKYNQLLRFILHLRVSQRVLARLSTLSSRASSASAHQSLVHRFHLLRAAVHHCIRVLHDYVLTHATLTAWPALLSALSSSPSSTSLARLRSHHGAYLERLLHLCLLTPNLSAAFAALQNIVGGVGAVESLGRLILHHLLDRTIDDWDDGDQADDDGADDDSWAYEEDNEERVLREARRKRRRQWMLALSEAEHAGLRERWQQRQEELQVECRRRLEELRLAHERNLRFFLLLLDQIASHGVHPHRQPRSLTHPQPTPAHPSAAMTVPLLIALHQPVPPSLVCLRVLSTVLALSTSLNFNGFI